MRKVSMQNSDSSQAVVEKLGLRGQSLLLIAVETEAKTMNAQISVSKTALTAFCQEHGIRRLAIYGSALRDDFGPDSDIDLLVEFEPERIPGLPGHRRHGNRTV